MGMEIDVTELSNGLIDLAMSIPKRVSAGAGSVAREMEGYAKLNAPWTDRTGKARRTMAGFVQWDEGGDLLVGIAGHMPYSPDLELRYGGRYAILVPTVDSYAPTILERVASAVAAEGGITPE